MSFYVAIWVEVRLELLAAKAQNILKWLKTDIFHI